MDEKKVREAICKLNVGINAKREKIKHNKVFCPKQDNSQLEEDIDIYETAIEALEKQLPKKPLLKQKAYVGMIVCPICEVSDYGKYCRHCGQRIKWSE